jgi:hypothetical protein
VRSGACDRLQKQGFDPIHKMSQEQARAEMEASGLEWVETKDVPPRQHFMVFEKPRTGD